MPRKPVIVRLPMAVSVRDAAYALSCDKQTVYDLINADELKTISIGMGPRKKVVRKHLIEVVKSRLLNMTEKEKQDWICECGLG